MLKQNINHVSDAHRHKEYEDEWTRAKARVGSCSIILRRFLNPLTNYRPELSCSSKRLRRARTGPKPSAVSPGQADQAISSSGSSTRETSGWEGPKYSKRDRNSGNCIATLTSVTLKLLWSRYRITARIQFADYSLRSKDPYWAVCLRQSRQIDFFCPGWHAKICKMMTILRAWIDSIKRNHTLEGQTFPTLCLTQITQLRWFPFLVFGTPPLTAEIIANSLILFVPSPNVGS